MTLLLPTLAEPRRFSEAERWIFITLAAAALTFFWLRLGPILARILESKKDADFHLRPIGRRVWDFVWEVMLQAKVIRQRPLAGSGACAGVLGVLRVCDGDAEPLRDDFRIRVPESCERARTGLRLLCRGFCAGLRGGHRGAVCAAVFGAAQMAGRSFHGSRD